MEVLFNFVWLTTAASLFVLLWRQIPREVRSRRISQQYLAVALLSFLLMPVISMTDDLHPMTMVAEGERTHDKGASVSNGSFHAVQPAFLPSAGSNTWLDQPLFCFGAISTPKDAPAVASPFFPSRSSRAPPAHAFLNDLS